VSDVTVIPLTDVEPVQLAGGSWSRVLVADSTVGGNASALGYVPARLWHTVVNPGDADLVMVFSFPSPAYPPTERRDPEDPRGE
jgi:oxalate decarboxylase/phosphoglucose isomerase-like protein (cupin superfamily)